jgi:hypothetical protein
MLAGLYFTSQYFPFPSASTSLKATVFTTTKYIRSLRRRYNRVRVHSVAVNILPASYGLSGPVLEDTNITQCTVRFE